MDTGLVPNDVEIPLGGFADSVIPPERPILFRVMVEVPDVIPELPPARLGGVDAEIWKSARTLTVTVTDRVTPGPAAVIVMTYVLDWVEAVVEMESVELAVDPGVIENELGLSDSPGPFDRLGEADAVRVTDPVSPRLWRLMLDVDVGGLPATKLLGDGVPADS
jgi:hypothetical protein